MKSIAASATLLAAIAVAGACGEPESNASPVSQQSAPRSASPQQSAPRSATPPVAQGPVRLQPPRVEFGFVQPHSKLDANVVIVNDLDRPFEIIAAKPSCQCTTVDLVGKVVPAKGTLEFPVSMKVSSTGVKQASVQIALEGLDRVLTVELRADVVYPIRGVTKNSAGGQADPFIDAATNPARVRGELTVESLDGQPFKVVSVGMKPPRFVDWDPSQPARASYRVLYDVSAPDCASMPRYLIIETDRLDAPLIDMRVRHQCTHIKPVIGFAEFRANAGVISPSVPGTFEIEIKHMNTPTGVGRVLAVTSTRPDMKAELVDQNSDGESVLAKVRITPLAGAAGVMLFPVRFTVAMPGQAKPIEEQLLVYCKAVP